MKLTRIALICLTSWIVAKVILSGRDSAEMASHISSNPRGAIAVMALFGILVWGLLRLLRQQNRD